VNKNTIKIFIYLSSVHFTNFTTSLFFLVTAIVQMYSFDSPYKTMLEHCEYIEKSNEYHKQIIAALQDCLTDNPNSNICDWVHLFQIYYHVASCGAALVMIKQLLNGLLINEIRETERHSVRRYL